MNRIVWHRTLDGRSVSYEVDVLGRVSVSEEVLIQLLKDHDEMLRLRLELASHTERLS